MPPADTDDNGWHDVPPLRAMPMPEPPPIPESMPADMRYLALSHQWGARMVASEVRQLRVEQHDGLRLTLRAVGRTRRAVDELDEHVEVATSGASAFGPIGRLLSRAAESPWVQRTVTSCVGMLLAIFAAYLGVRVSGVPAIPLSVSPAVAPAFAAPSPETP